MNNHLNTIHATMCEKVIIMRVGLRSGGWGCAGSAESDALREVRKVTHWGRFPLRHFYGELWGYQYLKLRA